MCISVCLSHILYSEKVISRLLVFRTEINPFGCPLQFFSQSGHATLYVSLGRILNFGCFQDLSLVLTWCILLDATMSVFNYFINHLGFDDANECATLVLFFILILLKRDIRT